MVLLIFWITIAANRILNLLKSSPVIIIWLVIITGSFIYAFTNNHIAVNMDTVTFFIITVFFMFSSVLKSLKKINVTPILITYSKSKFSNKYIYIRFLIKRAIINNLLLIIFSIIAFNALLDKIKFFILIGITIFSVINSFLLMYSINRYKSSQITKPALIRLKINPRIKSAVFDYLTADFLAAAVLCIAMFLILLHEIVKGASLDNNLKLQTYFPILMTVVFGFGFMGIIEPVQNINWKFHALLSANDFKYHVKRTMLFLAAVFCWLFAVFTGIGIFISVTLLLKCLFCITVLFLASIFTAFTITNMLIKAITLFFLLALTVWISMLPAPFLFILLIPVIITFLKAKNEYREWYLL